MFLLFRITDSVGETSLICWSTGVTDHNSDKTYDNQNQKEFICQKQPLEAFRKKKVFLKILEILLPIYKLVIKWARYQSGTVNVWEFFLVYLLLLKVKSWKCLFN